MPASPFPAGLGHAPHSPLKWGQHPSNSRERHIGRGSASPRLGSGGPRGLSPSRGRTAAPCPRPAFSTMARARGAGAAPRPHRHPALQPAELCPAPARPAAPRSGSSAHAGGEGEGRSSPWLPHHRRDGGRPRARQGPGMPCPVRFRSRLSRCGAGRGGCCGEGGRVVCACSFVSSNQISFVLQIASIASLCRGQTGSAENN